ncbi:TorF family putative porin [Thiohalophilus sp.]|uniref:TorF family putative porin n=1 Tax=Thiohalophilus sp. TaxID=3028392 RepID=UPI002ACD64AA|nr:TorF family putative porin [Thiohalophilus sp.]MDZ7660777.1 TorF family putative porin [Thiohalophilus sp.]MDZ7661324.1 TorF family putative porin [Thiohalophilus sp.]
MKHLASILLLAAGLPATASGQGELTGNLGVTSNYIWRGVTQTDDDASVQGGIDYTHETNLYAGVWTSNYGNGNGYELDLYGGYRGTVSEIPFDAGIIMYQYPVANTGDDATEIYGRFDFHLLTATAAFTIDKDGTSQDNDLYLSISSDVDLGEDRSLTLLLGMYEFDDPALEDYKHFHAALKKDEFVFALDKNDLDVGNDLDEMRVSVSWQRNFDL